MSNRTLLSDGVYFRVYSTPYGAVEMIRKSDGASAFFQGDDATELRAELEKAEANRDEIARLGYAVSSDYVCSSYFLD